MNLKQFFTQLEASIHTEHHAVINGIVTRISGVILEARGLKVSIGSICKISTSQGKEFMLAEVIGFSNEATFLMTFEEPYGILPGAHIKFVENKFNVPVGSQLKGRVINGFCIPIDNKGPLNTTQKLPLASNAINPIERQRITLPLDVGIRAINGLITVGRGQRLGIFAGSGVGKSVLLGMITRYSEADVIIVGLIGERGREVKEFIEENIGEAHLKKTVVVTAPIDSSPLERTNGVLSAVTIAEHYRNQGMNVLLIIDSLTRYAQALRQMYLLLGEPPSSKGYSPSVFSKLSQLVERCGYGGLTQGSITAFFTILTEGDDMNDPVADHARSVLDGHIVLSRALAETGHYPAIDINASISRVMSAVVSKEHNKLAMQFKRLFAHLTQNQDLINMGMYKPNTDPILDEALKLQKQLIHFLNQDVQEKISFNEAVSQLNNLFVETCLTGQA